MIDLTKPSNELEKILIQGKMVRTQDQLVPAASSLSELINQLEQSKAAAPQNPVAFINLAIATIDRMLGDQVNEILHHPDFQKLEGSWRGLNYLVMNTETSESLKLRLINVSKKELLDDMEKAAEFDQSHLFRIIYEQEYGTYGGHPYSCLVGDFEFGRHPQDIELLEKLSGVAAAAHAPFIAASSPAMFDLDSFSHLGIPRDLAKIFESTEMTMWHSFRASEDSRYIALTLPHVLMRLPYGPDTVPVEGFFFREDVDGTDNSKFCWGNAAYMLASRITNAFAQYGWTAAIRGVEGGGLVEGLPAYTFKTTDGDVALKCPTEVAITDRREKELSKAGLIALCHCKGADTAAFFGGQTTQKSKIYNTNEANANAELSARLPYILAASRFAHYIKAMMRDKVGSFMSRDEVSIYLNNWLAGYILLNDDAPQDMKARFPLREGRVDVFDVPGEPGSYRAVVFLRPHFQLEELTVSLRLVASLPKAAG